MKEKCGKEGEKEDEIGFTCQGVRMKYDQGSPVGKSITVDQPNGKDKIRCAARSTEAHPPSAECLAKVAAAVQGMPHAQIPESHRKDEAGGPEVLVGPSPPCTILCKYSTAVHTCPGAVSAPRASLAGSKKTFEKFLP